jgi:hypothetical protein
VGSGPAAMARGAMMAARRMVSFIVMGWVLMEVVSVVW